MGFILSSFSSPVQLHRNESPGSLTLRWGTLRVAANWALTAD
jgi:hypothetical protein